MDKVLFVKSHTELCDLLRPFLEAKGVELSYCEQAKRWSLKMTSFPIKPTREQ